MEDRISALPDDILRYILSFLPTKFAFTTSVLSKRWTPICYSLTALHFDDEAGEDEETYIRFRRFIDNVLLSPSLQHHPIETLSIVSHSEIDPEQSWFDTTDEWIEALKRRRVKNLQLSHFHSLLPGIFTSSQTLVVLKLTEIIMDHGIGSINLPSLTTLHLINVLFGEMGDPEKILNGCPNVEDLIALSPDIGSPFPGGFKTLPKVVKAHINAFDVPFNAIPNVEFLHIENMGFRCQDKCIDSYFREMPMFQNLINLKLSFVIFPVWAGVMEVLPYCPKLQSLAIEKLVNRKNYQEKWAHTKEPVPKCVSLHLTTCSIGNYQIEGMHDVLDFAAYILQNAMALEVLTLHINPRSKESEMDQLVKHLSQCPRISPACKVECKYRQVVPFCLSL